MTKENKGALRGLAIAVSILLVAVLAADGWARVGGGRSSGSRGSRSFSAPRPAPSPAPSLPYGGARQYGSPATPQTPAPSGGFLRSMAGGILGGMLGGMLFRSLGFAGGAGGWGGGIGLMDIILVGGLLYGIYWFMKRRRSEAAVPAGTYWRQQAGEGVLPPDSSALRDDDPEKGLYHLRQMDPHFDERRFTDTALDFFFRIQGAWAARDMTAVRDLLTGEMFRTLQQEADSLRQQGLLNRLENIAVRTAEIVEVWQEQGADFITVKIYANLLDYTVEERTGRIVSGSKTEPVKFVEYWTFTRPVGDNPWQLAAINQAE